MLKGVSARNGNRESASSGGLCLGKKRATDYEDRT